MLDRKRAVFQTMIKINTLVCIPIIDAVFFKVTIDLFKLREK